MAADNRDVLEVLKFELSFLEDGGYGRSPHAPWRAPAIFEDSPICPNFSDPARPHPCKQCLLIDFVPQARRNEDVPCRFIPLKENGETVDDLTALARRSRWKNLWITRCAPRFTESNRSAPPQTRRVLGSA